MKKIDIHCHVLPKLDDGSSSLQESIRMLKLAYRQGIQAVVATPHDSHQFRQEDPEKIRNLCRRLETRARAEVNPDFRVYPGEEIFYSQETLEKLREKGVKFEILFLDASDQALIKRYKETRRSHPLAGEGRVDKGIDEERRRLVFLKQQADYIIDTSQMLTRELRAEIHKIFVENKNYKNLYVTILSFGFKYGIPGDADLVFDVRFLPNPYYITELRPMSGNDAPVRDYVMNSETARIFLDKLTDMVQFLIPNYVAEGKNQLVIAIGCTGGKHRSVTLANALYYALEQEEGYGLKIEHRDIEKDARVKGI